MEINEYFSNSLVDAAEVRAHCKLSSAEVHDRAQLEAQGKFAVFAAQVRKMQALLDVFADATAENVAVSPSSIAAHTHRCRAGCCVHSPCAWQGSPSAIRLGSEAKDVRPAPFGLLRLFNWLVMRCRLGPIGGRMRFRRNLRV